MIIFLISIETICCDPPPPSELFCRDSSDKGSQHMVLCRIHKNYPLLSPNTPSYLELRVTVACWCVGTPKNICPKYLCINAGNPKIINFSFESNRKLMVLGVQILII